MKKQLIFFLLTVLCLCSGCLGVFTWTVPMGGAYVLGKKAAKESEAKHDILMAKIYDDYDEENERRASLGMPLLPMPKREDIPKERPSLM